MQNQQEFEELEQYGRRLCLRFEGVPTEKNETSDKVLDKIIGICKDLGVEIPDTVADCAHSIGVSYVDKTTKKSCNSVIVRFSTFYQRTIVYQMKKNLKCSVRVKIDLTKKRHNLLVSTNKYESNIDSESINDPFFNSSAERKSHVNADE